MANYHLDQQNIIGFLVNCLHVSYSPDITVEHISDLLCFQSQVAGIPPIFVGLVLMFVQDEAHKFRKEKKQSIMLENTDREQENERLTTEVPRHWIRKSTGHWKEIGRAMIQPTFLLILFSATIRHLGTLVPTLTPQPR